MPANEPDKDISYLPSHQIHCWQQASRTEGSPWLACSYFHEAAITDHHREAKNKWASFLESELRRLSTGSMGT